MTEKTAPISTTQYKAELFSVHGHVEFSRAGQVLTCTATGPFNKELIDAIAHIQAEILPELMQNGAWQAMVIIRSNALATPDALSAFTGYLRQQLTQGIASSATAIYVEPDAQGGKFMGVKIAQCYQDADLVHQLFGDIESAKQWLIDRR